MRKIILILICFCAVGLFFLQKKPRPVAKSNTVNTAPVAEAPMVIATPKPGLLSAAQDHVIFLGEDSLLYGWGDNNNSKQLGLELHDYVMAPIALVTPGQIATIHTGGTASYVITDEGKLLRRGFADVERRLSLTYGQYLPVFVDKRWRKVEQHWSIAAGIDSDGKLWAWRDLDFFNGEMGPQATRGQVQVALVPMSSSSQWKDFCVGHGNINAIDAQGVWWRSETKDKMDFNGSALQATASGPRAATVELVKVPASANFEKVYCRDNADHVIALDGQHKMWGYGSNKHGELGNGDDDPYKQTTAIDATAAAQLNQQSWIDVAIGSGFTVAIARDGSLWSWGLNTSRQLGLNDEQSHHSKPNLVDKTQVWSAVSAGHDFAVAMNQQGVVFTWGTGQFGKLPDGSILKVQVLPTKMDGLPKGKID